MLKIITSSLLMFSQCTYAATLYHCGNTYQDKPCSSSANTATIKNIPQKNSNSTSNANHSAITVDSDCKERGETAKKIMWTREVGKTAEQQVESGLSNELVKDVYNHRGSSLDVMNAIMQECMQQKEQNILDEKLMLEAQRLRGNAKVSGESSTSNREIVKPTTVDTKVTSLDSGHVDNDKNITCTSLKAGVDKLTAKRRTGGSASYMNNLKVKQDQLERDINTYGC